MATRDAYDPAVMNGFQAEMRDAVAVVHGDAELPERPGHAGGTYRSDVSPWLLAWSIGIEWDPQATSGDRPHERRAAAVPRLLLHSRRGATPMESWLA